MLSIASMKKKNATKGLAPGKPKYDKWLKCATETKRKSLLVNLRELSVELNELMDTKKKYSGNTIITYKESVTPKVPWLCSPCLYTSCTVLLLYLNVSQLCII